VSWQEAVLDFWFGLDPQRHWRRDAALDGEVTARFEALWREQQQQLAASFTGSAEQALAAIILFDQFPRNMFRGHRRSFATDSVARRIATAAVERGFDRQVPVDRRHFFYMPFQHSEKLADQERSLALFEALGSDYHMGFARKHHDVIARFGRFPHRNEMLGREPTEDEKAFGPEPAW
jgi:uncharacterized protein (DUF924 family)